MPRWISAPRTSGHVGQPTHHLDHFIERRAVVVRPRQETLEAGVDESLMRGRQAGVVQAVLGHGAGLEVFCDHIGSGAQAARRCSAVRMLQVELNAFLVAVEHGKEPCPCPQQVAGTVALDGLHLDDLGPQVRQHHAAGGAHHHVGELHYA